jgi:hypothetical protein
MHREQHRDVNLSLERVRLYVADTDDEIVDIQATRLSAIEIVNIRNSGHSRRKGGRRAAARDHAVFSSEPEAIGSAATTATRLP